MSGLYNIPNCYNGTGLDRNRTRKMYKHFFICFVLCVCFTLIISSVLIFITLHTTIYWQGYHLFYSFVWSFSYIRTVDSRYLKIQGTLWNTSRYPYFDKSDLRNWGKQLIKQPPLVERICKLPPKLEIYWKYCGKDEKLLLRSSPSFS